MPLTNPEPAIVDGGVISDGGTGTGVGGGVGVSAGFGAGVGAGTGAGVAGVGAGGWAQLERIRSAKINRIRYLRFTFAPHSLLSSVSIRGWVFLIYSL